MGILIYAVGFIAIGFMISKLAKSGSDEEDETYDSEGAFDDAASWAYCRAYPNGSSPYEVVAVDFYFKDQKYTGYYKGCSRPVKIG
jgi:hypothetical protein